MRRRSAVQNHLQTNINSCCEIMRLDWREIEDRLFVVSNRGLRTLTLAIWESPGWTRSRLIARQSDPSGLSLRPREESSQLLSTWDSEIENHNLQIMSTLAKECGAESQDGFTKARLTEFMPPSFECQYKPLQSRTARIIVRKPNHHRFLRIKDQNDFNI